MNLLDRSLEDSKDEHMHLSLSDVVLESVMVFRSAAGAVAEVVVPLGRANSYIIYGIIYMTCPQKLAPPSKSLPRYCTYTYDTVYFITNVF